MPRPSGSLARLSVGSGRAGLLHPAPNLRSTAFCQGQSWQHPQRWSDCSNRRRVAGKWHTDVNECTGRVPRHVCLVTGVVFAHIYGQRCSGPYEQVWKSTRLFLQNPFLGRWLLCIANKHLPSKRNSTLGKIMVSK